MNKPTKYCPECEVVVTLSEDGYCLGCGTHADNMTRFSKTTQADEYLDDEFLDNFGSDLV